MAVLVGRDKRREMGGFDARSGLKTVLCAAHFLPFHTLAPMVMPANSDITEGRWVTASEAICTLADST
jgi:hypothetical protein